MPRRSAGILLHRRLDGGEPEVLLVHPGGPFWAKKDAGAWSIPKGEHGADDDPLTAARREFAEELGRPLPAGEIVPLGEVRQKGGKLVTAWAVAGDLDPATIVSNSFELEWPPRSGRRAQFPEVDRAEWFTLDRAREKLLPAQLPLLDRIAELIDG
ncbi:NUDIX domain-containing protein [Conexibacter stalactiti]|uniref:NUDIX domain-containing protein n=1 Tax=Conexibacter stalactiti TaxID=1940611 RepID=A0ABU4HKF8_9ACTN|nr:NUDIX domain-containing protein [Conexibacter stalactiti]MDW5593784.1 NUDIX domain-containing protein [Conexibacter stalactiti]MEC5034426.1 NUDIX domain-containing protein [Conexibacter stalactiti]